MWTEGLEGQILEFPSAHGEGRPLAQAAQDLNSFHVVFRYCDAKGNPTQHYPENPNGALSAVAGITDETGLVLGLMPHPERASLATHSSQDGFRLFQNLVKFLK
jgi:phosphoribosylformylglycinamidine synthase subunit PurQ / glutaminase